MCHFLFKSITEHIVPWKLRTSKGVTQNTLVVPGTIEPTNPPTPTRPPTSFLFPKYFAKYRAVAAPRSNFFGKGNVFTGVCLFTISLMATWLLLILVTAWSVHILLECFLAKIFPKYRSRTLNLNMVNSKFHWIWRAVNWYLIQSGCNLKV